MRQCFINLGAARVEIRLSHRGVFNRMLERLGVGSAGADVLRAVDKIKKAGAEEVRKTLTEIAGAANAELILDFIKPEGDSEATLKKITALAGGEAEDTARLAAIFGWLKDVGAAESFTLDPSITRGLDYYTGIVFETFLAELPAIGSVCSGGRYNDLASLYTKERLPGVGASVGLDRLLAALEELGQKTEAAPQTQAVIFCADEKDMAAYHRVAFALRQEGVSAEVYPEARKQAHQFAWAEKKGVAFGVFAQSGAGDLRLDLRDLRSRETIPGLDPCRAAAEIKKRLAPGNP
jgi:histidyl-tRNA synthetase